MRLSRNIEIQWRAKYGNNAGDQSNRRARSPSFASALRARKGPSTCDPLADGRNLYARGGFWRLRESIRENYESEGPSCLRNAVGCPKISASREKLAGWRRGKRKACVGGNDFMMRDQARNDAKCRFEEAGGRQRKQRRKIRMSSTTGERVIRGRYMSRKTFSCVPRGKITFLYGRRGIINNIAKARRRGGKRERRIRIYGLSRSSNELRFINEIVGFAEKNLILISICKLI